MWAQKCPWQGWPGAAMASLGYDWDTWEDTLHNARPELMREWAKHRITGIRQRDANKGKLMGRSLPIPKVALVWVRGRKSKLQKQGKRAHICIFSCIHKLEIAVCCLWFLQRKFWGKDYRHQNQKDPGWSPSSAITSCVTGNYLINLPGVVFSFEKEGKIILLTPLGAGETQMK